MKCAYKTPRKFNHANKALLNNILSVTESYRQQGYVLTLRQLYYQLVTQNIFANAQKNYAKLSDLLGEARMCGLCDWDIIEDRIRVPKMPNQWNNISDAMKNLIAVYRRKRWVDQPNYIEVWVEKDALSGVLLPITEDYHIHLMVNRGYSSISAMHDASIRFRIAAQEGKDCHLVYIGDLDPSGEDMVRDIENRLIKLWANVEVEKLSLTSEQVDEFNLPPNPTKTTDPRARGFMAENGESSWEADAMPPAELDSILRERLEELINRKFYDAWLKIEETEKEKMNAFAKANSTPAEKEEE